MRVVDFDPRRFYLVMLCKRIVAIVQSVTNADGLPLSASEADIVSIFRSILAIQLSYSVYQYSLSIWHGCLLLDKIICKGRINRIYVTKDLCKKREIVLIFIMTVTLVISEESISHRISDVSVLVSRWFDPLFQFSEVAVAESVVEMALWEIDPLIWSHPLAV